MKYKGFEVEKVYYNGFFVTYTNKGILKADTLKGIKSIITRLKESMKNEN